MILMPKMFGVDHDLVTLNESNCSNVSLNITIAHFQQEHLHIGLQFLQKFQIYWIFCVDVKCFQYWVDRHINLNISFKSGSEIEDGVESTPSDCRNQTSSLHISLEVKNLIGAKRRLIKIWQ